MRRTTRSLTLLACGMAASMALSGCVTKQSTPGSATTGAVPESSVAGDNSRDTTATDPASSEKPASANWSITVDYLAPVIFTPRAIVAIGNQSVDVYGRDGKRKWAQPIPARSEVRVVGTSVIMMTKTINPSSGLDKSSEVVKAVVYSLEDGGTRKEVTLPAGDISDHRRGAGVVERKPEGFKYHILDDQGSVREIQKSTSLNDLTRLFGLIDGAPFFVSPTNVTGDIWKAEGHQTPSDASSLDIGHKAFLFGDQVQNSAMKYTVRAAKDGRVLASQVCPSRYQSTGEIVSSPNGKYAVTANIIITESSITCVGGQENQKRVKLSSVDDSGTAYGTADDVGRDATDVVRASADGKVTVTAGNPKLEVPTVFLEGNVPVFKTTDTEVQSHPLPGN